MKKDWKNWKLSDSGLQIYEGNKHIATVHYGGNPIVDINEAVENAKIIQQVPDLTARAKELEEALQEAAEALGDAQGEWGCTNKAYAPEWTHPLKDAEEAALEALRGEA